MTVESVTEVIEPLKVPFILTVDLSIDAVPPSAFVKVPVPVILTVELSIAAVLLFVTEPLMVTVELPIVTVPLFVNGPFKVAALRLSRTRVPALVMPFWALSLPPLTAVSFALLPPPVMVKLALSATVKVSFSVHLFPHKAILNALFEGTFTAPFDSFSALSPT